MQGLGKDGSFQCSRMLEYGTNIVAAVHPNKRGQVFEKKVPYFETVNEAIEQTGANAGVIFVPAFAAVDVIIEQADANLDLTICITEGIPIQDMIKVKAYLKNRKTRLVGPNCPGLLSPATKTKIGIIPPNQTKVGSVGVVSRSGTLTYEANAQIVSHGLGQSTCIGIGGDPVNGTDFKEVLALFQADDETDAIVLIGEIGGMQEQIAADYIKDFVTKPVVAYIAGKTAPAGKRMGHAGAIIAGESATAQSKMAALEDAGAKVVASPAEIGNAVKSLV